VLGGEQIAARVEADCGKEKICGSSAGRGSAAASHPEDPLYRLAKPDDVDRRRNAVRRAGNAEVLHKGLFSRADHQDRNIGSLPYRDNRIGTGVACRIAEVQHDDIRLAAADEGKEMGVSGDCVA